MREPTTPPGPQADPETNEVTFPVADTGWGEATATLRVSQDVESAEILRDTLKWVAQSISPHVTVEVIFGSKTPPPILVTLDQVAECLMVPRGYVKDLVKFGWLTPVHFRASDDPNVRAARAEQALLSGKWSGWDVRFLWSELVELEGWCREHQHLPSYAAPLRQRIQVPGKPAYGNIPRTSVAAVTRRVLREAKKDDGTPAYVATKDIHKRVQEIMHWKLISYKTVESALLHAHKRRHVRRITYKADYRNKRGAAWRWLPDNERKTETFERLLSEPPQDDEETA